MVGVMDKPMTLRRVKNIVKRLEADGQIDADSLDAATLMVSALVVGANQRRLRAFTGLPQEYIREVAERMRENHIWVNGKTHCSWADEDASADFILDLLVARGLLAKTEAAA